VAPELVIMVYYFLILVFQLSRKKGSIVFPTIPTVLHNNNTRTC